MPSCGVIAIIFQLKSDGHFETSKLAPIFLSILRCQNVYFVCILFMVLSVRFLIIRDNPIMWALGMFKIECVEFAFNLVRRNNKDVGLTDRVFNLFQ